MEKPDHLDCEPDPDPGDYHDHDLDWPWTLYFNGEAVHRWANCWNSCDLSGKSREMFEEYPWMVDHSDFLRLCHRMDLAHQVESEDPVLFRVQTLSMLVLLLRHEAHVRGALGSHAGDSGNEAIFESLRDGIAAMHTLTVRDGFAFWSVGYQDDQKRLAAAMEQSRLPQPPENYVAPPHILERNRLAEDRLHSLRCELLDWIKTKGQPKDFRRFIHQLPTRV